MTDTFDAAQKRLETATVQFENLERLFEERKITVEALRQAWDEMDRARRDVDRLAKERLRTQGIL